MNKKEALYPSISCFAFNGDNSRVAICPNNSTVHIYDTCGKPEDYKAWKKTDQELLEHDLLVSSIDWAPKTNRILTCSQDINAYVWCEEEEEYKDKATGDMKKRMVWNQKLVVLKTNRAAAVCKWSPDESVFAVGTAATELGICTFDKTNDWWSAKNIRKFASTVTCCDWHPTNEKEILAGGTDSRVRGFQCQKKKQPCGLKYNTSGWVLDVKFSPSGSFFAVTLQSSTIVVYPYTPDFENTHEENNGVEIPLPTLPCTQLLFVRDDLIVGIGHEYSPILIKKSGDSWEYVGRCDRGQLTKAKSTSSVRNAFKKFGANKGKSTEGKGIAATRHKAAINSVRPTERDSNNNIVKFVTGGVDGRFCSWDVSSLEKDVEM